MDKEQINSIVRAAKILEPLEKYYSSYFYIMLLFNTLLTIFIFYVTLIKRHVKIQAEFRPLVAHTKIFSAMVMLSAALWQPITVPGALGGYSIGPLARFGENGYLFGQWLTWSLAAHIGTVITISFLVQCFHMKIFNHNAISEICDYVIQNKLMSHVCNFSLVFNGILVSFPHIAIKYTAINLREIPEFNDFLLTHPSFMLMPLSNNYAFLIVTCVAGICMTAQFILCIVANLLTYQAIRVTSGLVSYKTFSMQKSMYRLFTLRLMLIVFFLYISCLAIMLHIFQVFSFVYFPMLCIGFMCMYCPSTALIGFVGMPPLKKSFQSGSFFRPNASTSTQVQHISSNNMFMSIVAPVRMFHPQNFAAHRPSIIAHRRPSAY